MCHSGNMGVEQTPNKSQHTKLTLDKKILRCSCWDSNSQSFDHESSTLTNKLSLLPALYAYRKSVKLPTDIKRMLQMGCRLACFQLISPKLTPSLRATTYRRKKKLECPEVRDSPHFTNWQELRVTLSQS